MFCALVFCSSFQAQAQADLRLAYVAAAGDSKSTVMKVVVENVGKNDTLGFYVNIERGPKAVARTWVSGVKAGGSQTLSFTFDGLSKEDELIVVVDSEDQVAEAREDDDYASLRVEGGGAWSTYFWIDWAPNYCPLFCADPPEEESCVPQWRRNRVRVQLPDGSWIADTGWIEENWCPENDPDLAGEVGEVN